MFKSTKPTARLVRVPSSTAVLVFLDPTLLNGSLPAARSLLLQASPTAAAAAAAAAPMKQQQPLSPLPLPPSSLVDVLLSTVFSHEVDAQSYLIDARESARLLGSTSSLARQTAAGTGSHNLTYGEVAAESISKHVVNATRWTAEDVFYDLGSGTGKIPLQVALSTPARSKGIEFAEARHVIALAALARVEFIAAAGAATGGVSPRAGAASSASSSYALSSDHAGSEATASAAASAASPSPAGSAIPASLCNPAASAVLRSALGRLTLQCGDFLAAGAAEDATVIFINNTVFEPSLMIPLVARLAQLPKLRKLVVLRTLCARHNGRCEAAGAPCSVFAHPPQVATCKVRRRGERDDGG